MRGVDKASDAFELEIRRGLQLERCPRAAAGEDLAKPGHKA